MQHAGLRLEQHQGTEALEGLTHVCDTRPPPPMSPHTHTATPSTPSHSTHVQGTGWRRTWPPGN